MKRALSLLLSCMMLFPVLAGCSGGADASSPAAQESEAAAPAESNLSEASAESTAEPAGDALSGTLTFWTSMNEADQDDPGLLWWQETLKTFQDSNPGLKLEISNTPDGNQYLTKITTEIAAGNTPDVFRTWLTGRLEPFVTAGRVAPLNDFLEARPELKDTISPTALSFSTFGDSYYAIPMQKSGEVVFYNKKLFADNGLEVPKSYDEFMSACATLKGAGVNPVVCGNLDVWPGAVPYMMLFNRLHGNDLYEEVIVGKVAKFDDPAYADTGVKLQEMVNAGVFNDNINALKYDEAQVKFYTGEAGMVFDGLWAMTKFVEMMGEDCGFFNFPMVEGGKGSDNDYIVNYDEGFAISSTCGNLPAAEAFMEYIFSIDRQTKLAESGKLVASVNLPVDYSKMPSIMAEISAAIDNASYGFNAYDNPLGSNMGTEFNLAVQRVLSGEDPTTVFENLNKLAQAEWG